MTDKSVVIMSGGLDSSTLLADVLVRGYEAHAISFDYGQRHSKELEFAHRQCMQMGIEHEVVGLTQVGAMFHDAGSESSLIGSTAVPEGHYGEESMKATVVPNRNMIMMSIAAGWAVSMQATRLAIGVHAGDHFIYPDCRPDFITSIQDTIQRGNDGFWPPFIDAPFLNKTKNWIAQRAFDLGVDIAGTWSCYKGGDIHCGRCGTCVERQEAIASTGNADPTSYADETYWKEALKRSTV